jgi:hypothetical protein
MLPKDLESMLGTEEQFKKANPFLDEEHNELLDEKLNQEYQDERFDEMAMDALEDLGLTEDEAERELEDFKS